MNERSTGLVVFVAVVVGYLVVSPLAFDLLDGADPGDLRAGFISPAGIVMAALILSPARRWPIVLLAAGGAEFALDRWLSDYTTQMMAGFIAANLAGPMLGALLVKWRCGRIDLARRRDLGVFLASAVLIGPALAAGIGAYTANSGAGSELGSTFLEWWLGDGLAVLVVGSPIVARQASSDRRRLRSVEGFVLLVATVAASIAAYWATDLPIGFVLLFMVVTAGARFGTRTVTVTSLVTTAIAIGSLPADGQLIVGVDNPSGLVILKLQFAAFAAAGLIVAAEAFDREQAVEEAARERRSVAELQEALLPPRELSGPNFRGNGIYLAASRRLQVGGDWYDVAGQRDGRVFVSVGDVVGHGAQAVVVMGQLRYAMAAFAGLGASPAEVLEHMDEHAGRLEGAFATTIWAAAYDPETGQLTYSAAGHPPALLKRGGGEWEWLSDGRSIPIGLDQCKSRPNAVTQLDGPATLVVYTDGAVERPGETIDVGLTRLRDALAELEPLDAELLLRSVTTAERSDDTVVLWVELWPPGHDPSTGKRRRKRRRRARRPS